MIIILSYALIYIGLFFMITGTIGIYRFPDFFSRLHAIGVSDALGVPITLLGFALTQPFIISMKIILLIIVLWLTGIVATYAIAQSFYLRKK